MVVSNKSKTQMRSLMIVSNLENLQIEGYTKTKHLIKVFRVFFVVNGCWWYEPILDLSLKLGKCLIYFKSTPFRIAVYLLFPFPQR